MNESPWVKEDIGSLTQPEKSIQILMCNLGTTHVHVTPRSLSGMQYCGDINDTCNHDKCKAGDPYSYLKKIKTGNAIYGKSWVVSLVER